MKVNDYQNYESLRSAHQEASDQSQELLDTGLPLVGLASTSGKTALDAIDRTVDEQGIALLARNPEHGSFSPNHGSFRSTRIATKGSDMRIATSIDMAHTHRGVAMTHDKGRLGQYGVAICISDSHRGPREDIELFPVTIQRGNYHIRIQDEARAARMTKIITKSAMQDIAKSAIENDGQDRVK